MSPGKQSHISIVSSISWKAVFFHLVYNIFWTRAMSLLCFCGTWSLQSVDSITMQIIPVYILCLFRLWHSLFLQHLVQNNSDCFLIKATCLPKFLSNVPLYMQVCGCVFLSMTIIARVHWYQLLRVDEQNNNQKFCSLPALHSNSCISHFLFRHISLVDLHLCIVIFYLWIRKLPFFTYESENCLVE